eukprot:scaffold4648_cov158-Ochromonas_danica.AAC.6
MDHHNRNMLLFIIFINIVFSLHVLANVGYDNPAIFNPQGRLEQLEYAQKAISRKGGSVFALRCCDGLLVAAARKKPISPLVVEGARKVHLIDGGRILIGASGLLFESSLVIEAMEKKCADYRQQFASSIPIEVLCSETANLLHSITMLPTARPLAIGLIVAGCDLSTSTSGNTNLKVFRINTDGSFSNWKATAIGYNEDEVVKELAAMRSAYPDHIDPYLEDIWPRFKRLLLSSKIIEDKKEEDDTMLGEADDGSLLNASEFSRNWDLEVYNLVHNINGHPLWSRISSKDI